MKMVEISYRSITAELLKLNAKLERAQKALEKKQAKAEKLGVADMDNDAHREWLKGVETNEMGYILNKKDVQKNGAWFDLYSAQEDVKDITRQIENAEKRFNMAEEKVEAYHRELAAVEDLKAKEELMKKEFEAEQKEWARDGITLERRYHGITPNGKRFSIEGNSGWTNRSRHCFTLYLEGQGVVFTSGEFWRAYGVVKNN